MKSDLEQVCDLVRACGRMNETADILAVRSAHGKGRARARPYRRNR